jgi:hypothetical protein
VGFSSVGGDHCGGNEEVHVAAFLGVGQFGGYRLICVTGANVWRLVVEPRWQLWRLGFTKRGGRAGRSVTRDRRWLRLRCETPSE